MASMTWLDGTMPGAARRADRIPVVAFTDSCLRGVGQICFMNNPVTGALILVALFTFSAWLGVAVVLGLVVSTATGYLLGLERGLVRAGLFGFNGALVGAGFATFLAPPWSVAVAGYVVGGAVGSTLVTAAVGRLLATWRLPALTFPFNLVTLGWLLVAVALPRARPSPLLEPRDPAAGLAPAAAGEFGAADVLAAPFRGVSQLFLADSVLAGVLILLALLICSRIAAAVALVASVLGVVTGLVLGADPEAVLHGLWSYNGYVAAVAVSGVLLVPSVRSMVLGALAAVASAVVYAGLATFLAPWGLPALTLPFCLVTVVFVLLGDTMPGLRAVPLDAVTTPERHRADCRAKS